MFRDFKDILWFFKSLGSSFSVFWSASNWIMFACCSYLLNIVWYMLNLFHIIRTSTHVGITVQLFVSGAWFSRNGRNSCTFSITVTVFFGISTAAFFHINTFFLKRLLRQGSCHKALNSFEIDACKFHFLMIKNVGPISDWSQSINMINHLTYLFFYLYIGCFWWTLNYKIIQADMELLWRIFSNWNMFSYFLYLCETIHIWNFCQKIKLESLLGLVLKVVFFHYQHRS